MSESFIVEPRWILPVEPAGQMLSDHAIVVRDGRIDAVVPVDSLRSPAHESMGRFVLPEHVVMPGLVNAHTHAAMSLMRGLADDLPLMRWLQEHIWPAEAKHVSAEFVRDGTLLACAEMLRGGITCFNDMYFFPEAALEAAVASGIRASIGLIVIEFPSAYASDPEDYIRKGLALRDRHLGTPRTSFCLAPHAPYTVSDASFRRIASLSAELDLPIHVHVHETNEEIERSIAEHGIRPLARLDRLGVLGPGLIAVHSVHIDEQDIALLARYGCSIAHCPSSNLKLASGFSPISAAADAGINISIGTDGAASNNRLDMFEEARLAALLAKAVSGNAQALPAHAALRAATLGGAQALGLESTIGSLLPGKAADMIAVRLSGPELSPCYDPASHLVYAAGREHVTDVWVDGNLRIRNGSLVQMGHSALDARWELWQNRLRSQSSD